MKHNKNALEGIKNKHAEMHLEHRNCGVNRPLQGHVGLVL